MTELTQAFEAERPRLVRLATRLLADVTDAEDVVQQAWLRLHSSDAAIESLPAWLTTVTTRLCLDRLRARPASPVDVEVLQAHVAGGDEGDPAEQVALADTVAVALHVVLERLTPRERVAFVLHDSFGFEFPTIAAVLETTPAAARKLASRARAKVGRAGSADRPADWQVVDAFMAAARGGDLHQLLRLLAPDVRVRADASAAALGAPERLDGSEAVAAFFDGSASAALPVLVEGRPASAWFQRGRPRVLFDVTIADGTVHLITFRADAEVLAGVVRRTDAARRG